MNIRKAKDIVVNCIKNNWNYIFPREIYKLRFFVVIDMLFKSILFMGLVEVGSADKFDFNSINFSLNYVYLAFVLLIYSIGYLFIKKKQVIYYIAIDLIYSSLLIIDLWYFRVNRDFIGLKNIFYSGTFNPLGESLYQFKTIDLLFVLGPILIGIYLYIKKVQGDDTRDKLAFKTIFNTSIAMIIISVICIDFFNLTGWSNRVLTKRWTTLMSARASGPIGYHFIETVRTLSKVSSFTSSKEKEEIESWINYNNEDLEPNIYSGIAKGKNVIFIQIESLENFVINKSTNGKEISPFLNKLTKEGLYFTNIYEQNNAGNSIDCDFMVNTSIYPLGDKITALDYGENVYRNSLSRILNDEGYMTISSHAEEIGDFNWTELHKNGFGAKELWDISHYIYEEIVGYGLSDRSFLSQIADKLENLEEPFFFQAATLSNHGPFDIDDKYRELDLPKEVDESYLGGYFESVRYTDRQIEMFFNKLDESGMLDNTMVVLYGDHGGVHKYYNEDIVELDYEGNWWKEYDNKIPLIIYSKGMEPSAVEASGGQVDILPTVSYLLGIDKNKYLNTSMGRVLVNTNRDATIIKGNEIKGSVKSYEEKEHLLKSYEIGEKIIKNNYLDKKQLSVIN